MSNLPTNYCLKVDFQNADLYATSKRLIQSTIQIKDNQLQRLELQGRISYNCEYKFDISMWKIAHIWWRWNPRSPDYIKGFT